MIGDTARSSNDDMMFDRLQGTKLVLYALAAHEAEYFQSKFGSQIKEVLLYLKG